MNAAYPVSDDSPASTPSPALSLGDLQGVVDGRCYLAAEKALAAFSKQNPRPSSPFASYQDDTRLQAYDAFAARVPGPWGLSQRDTFEVLRGRPVTEEGGLVFLNGPAGPAFYPTPVVQKGEPGPLASLPDDVLWSLVRAACADADGSERRKIEAELVAEEDARRKNRERMAATRAEERKPADLDIESEGLAEWTPPALDGAASSPVLCRLGLFARLAGLDNVTGLRRAGVIKTTNKGKRQILAAVGKGARVPTKLGVAILAENAKHRDPRPMTRAELVKSWLALRSLESAAKEARVEVMSMFTAGGFPDRHIFNLPAVQVLAELAIRQARQPLADALAALVAGIDPPANMKSNVERYIAAALERALAGGENTFFSPGEPGAFERISSAISSMFGGDK